MSEYLKQRMAHILAGRPLKQSVRKPIAPISEKRKEKLKEQGTGKDQLHAWFEARRAEMTGKCALCGGKTEKHNDETFKRSIHHLFDKRPTMFPSVALNIHNFLEVCFYGNSCHTNIHNGTITWELLKDSAEWEMIMEKVKKVFPYIDKSEKKNIPEVVLKELEKCT